MNSTTSLLTLLLLTVLITHATTISRSGLVSSSEQGNEYPNWEDNTNDEYIPDEAHGEQGDEITVEDNNNENNPNNADVCPICQDIWLKKYTTCPLCRQTPLIQCTYCNKCIAKNLVETNCCQAFSHQECKENKLLTSHACRNCGVKNNSYPYYRIRYIMEQLLSKGYNVGVDAEFISESLKQTRGMFLTDNAQSKIRKYLKNELDPNCTAEGRRPNYQEDVNCITENLYEKLLPSIGRDIESTNVYRFPRRQVVLEISLRDEIERTVNAILYYSTKATQETNKSECMGLPLAYLINKLKVTRHND